jgi:hypothetical protein
MDNTVAADTKNRILQGTIGNTGKYFGRRAVNGIERLLGRAVGGAAQGQLWATVLDDAGTRGAGNIACTRANAANDTITFTYGARTVVLTEGVDFLRGASDTTCAANLAAAINAHVVLGADFLAAGTVGDCAVTARVPTALLQDFAISTSDATAFTLTQLTGGTEGAAQFALQRFDLSGAP